MEHFTAGEWVTIVGGIVAAVIYALANASILIYQTVKMNKNARAARSAMSESKTIAIATHALVNSAMLAQLRLHAATAQRLAQLTGSPDDVAAAELALKLVAQHEQQNHE